MEYNVLKAPGEYYFVKVSFNTDGKGSLCSDCGSSSRMLECSLMGVTWCRVWHVACGNHHGRRTRWTARAALRGPPGAEGAGAAWMGALGAAISALTLRPGCQDAWSPDGAGCRWPSAKRHSFHQCCHQSRSSPACPTNPAPPSGGVLSPQLEASDLLWS